MNYRLRKANEDDKSKVLLLGKKIVDKYERTHLGDEMGDGYINSGACDADFLKMYENIHVLTLDDNIVGLTVFTKNEIQGFLVDIPYWGTGAAQYMLKIVFEIIRKEYDIITLECFETSPRANAFYTKMGFENKGIVEGDGGRRIVYAKNIKVQ